MFLAILFTLLGTNWSFGANRPKHQAMSLAAFPSIELISLLISVEQREINPYFDFLDVLKTIGPAAIPSTIGLYIISTNNQLTRDLIAGNKDLIAANNAANKDLIAANKDLIAANKEIAAESIKSSEAKIENILREFKISFQSSANNKES